MKPAIEHRATFPLPVPATKAFRALVEPAQLSRWFAEHVKVEPRAGGTFAFHGLGTYGTTGGQTITAIDDSSLAFEWTIHGVPTEVRWRVVDGKEPDTSTFEIDHTVFGALPAKNPKHLIDDLWRIHHGNLSEHLRGSTNVVLPDLASAKPEVRLSIEIAAKPSKVFRALLDPALMNRWLGGAARVDVERREYSYGWSYPCEGRIVAGGPTRILEMVENKKLVTDWTDWRGDPAKPMTRVTWLLEPLDNGARTRVTILHDGFEHPIDRSDYQQGWWGFAEELEKVVTSS